MSNGRKKFSENMACMKLFDRCLSTAHTPGEFFFEELSEQQKCKLQLKDCLEAERAEIRRMRKR